MSRTTVVCIFFIPQLWLLLFAVIHCTCYLFREGDLRRKG